MTDPQTQAARMHLLACDLDTGKLVDRDWLDYLVRGATLIDLLAGDYLTDADGAARRVDVAPPDDTVLDRVLQEIEEDGRHPWKQLLHHSRPTFDALREQLAHVGLIEARQGRDHYRRLACGRGSSSTGPTSARR